MQVNQEALTTQMEDLRAGAVALPGGRKLTQKIEETDIDIPGGPGVLSTGEIKTLGKKKQDQPVTQTDSADLLAEMLSGLDIDPVNVDPVGVAEVVAEQATNPSVTGDNDEILFKAKDLGTLDGDPELGGFIRTEVDSSLQGLTDLDFTDTTRPVEVDDFTVAGSEPFQISSEFSTQSERAANLLPSVVGRTVIGGEDLLPTIKDTAQNFVLQNSGLVGEGIRFKNSVDTISNSSLDNPFSAINAGSAALNAAQILGNTLGKIERDGIEAVITDTYDRIKSSVVGIVDMIGNPGDTFKMLHNNMWYGATRPIITSIPLAFGQHSFTMDENGNLATPAWISLFTPKIVGAAYTLAQQYLSMRGSHPLEGSPLQVARGTLSGTKTFGDIGEGVAPSYRDAVIQNYHNVTDAAIIGGLKYDETIATYASGRDTYANIGDRPPGSTNIISQMFNLNMLASFTDTPVGQYSADQLGASTPEFNKFVYTPEEVAAFTETVNRNIVNLKGYVSEITGREITTGAELVEAINSDKLHGPMIDAFNNNFLSEYKEDFLSQRGEGYEEVGGGGYLFDTPLQERQYYADLARKQGGNAKLVYAATKKTIPPAIKPTDARDNFADSVANDHNFTYGMNRNLFSVGNIIARAGKDTTGNWTYGFNGEEVIEGKGTYIGDTALSTAIHDHMQIHYNGDMSKLTDVIAKDIAKQYAFDKAGADSIGKQALEKLTGGTAKQPVTKEVAEAKANLDVRKQELEAENRLEEGNAELKARKEEAVRQAQATLKRLEAQAGEPAEGPPPTEKTVTEPDYSEWWQDHPESTFDPRYGTEVHKVAPTAKQLDLTKYDPSYSLRSTEFGPHYPGLEFTPETKLGGQSQGYDAGGIEGEGGFLGAEAKPEVGLEPPPPAQTLPQEIPSGKAVPPIAGVTQDYLAPPIVGPWELPTRTPSSQESLLRTEEEGVGGFLIGEIRNASDLSRVTPTVEKILQRGRGSYRQDLYKSEEGYDFAAEARAREAASPEVKDILADLGTQPISLAPAVDGSGIDSGTAFPKPDVTAEKLPEAARFGPPGEKPMQFVDTTADSGKVKITGTNHIRSGAVEISMGEGATFKSPVAGTVVYKAAPGEFRGYDGGVVTIEDKSGTKTIFMHVNIDANVGDTVTKENVLTTQAAINGFYINPAVQTYQKNTNNLTLQQAKDTVDPNKAIWDLATEISTPAPPTVSDQPPPTVSDQPFKMDEPVKHTYISGVGTVKSRVDPGASTDPVDVSGWGTPSDPDSYSYTGSWF